MILDLFITFGGLVLTLATLAVFVFGVIAAIDPSKAADRRAERREGTRNDL